MLHIYEFDHNATPMTQEDWYEVYEENSINSLYVSHSFSDVIDYCYKSGKEFVVHTLAAYYNEYGAEL